MEKEEIKYWAFISYSSLDKKVGRWLHQRLENYPIPSEFQGLQIFDGAVLGKHLRPIFRDRDELAGASDLATAIQQALNRSRFLIVLCSPNSAKSPWVNKEIMHFVSHRQGNDRRILALIVDGEPNATSNPQVDDDLECFPPALRSPVEPLAGDMRERGDGKERGFLKILSGISQLDFDALYRRHERAQRKKRITYGLTATAIIVLLTLLTIFAFSQKRIADEQRALAIHQHAETFYREGMACKDRGESYLALNNFLQAVEKQPEWRAPLLQATELLARRYWPVEESVVELNHSEEDDYFCRQMNDAILLGQEGPLLLRSNVGLRVADPTLKKSKVVSQAEAEKLLEGGPCPGADSKISSVEYHWDDKVAFGMNADYAPFMYLMEDHRMLVGEPLGDANQSGRILQYSSSSKRLIMAEFDDDNKNLVLTAYEESNGKLAVVNREKFPLPEFNEQEEVYLKAVDREAKRAYLSAIDRSWIVAKDEIVELPLSRVERVSFSPSGDRAAILRSIDVANHGDDNFSFSIITLDDFFSISAYPKDLGSLKDGLIFTGITCSEEVPLRNIYMGFTGKWYEQGYTEVRFLSEDKIIIFCGDRLHIYRLWDRRALTIFSKLAEMADAPEDSSSVGEYARIINGNLELSGSYGKKIVREEFPITQVLDLGDHKFFATASSYKGYGEAVSVWDRESTTRVIGPLAARNISSDSNLTTLKASRFFMSYQCEILAPQRADAWFLELGNAILKNGYGAIPDQSKIPASLSESERELAMRLLSRAAVDDLPMQVGSKITRKEWRQVHLPKVDAAMRQDSE